MESKTWNENKNFNRFKIEEKNKKQNTEHKGQTKKQEDGEKILYPNVSPVSSMKQSRNKCQRCHKLFRIYKFKNHSRNRFLKLRDLDAKT